MHSIAPIIDSQIPEHLRSDSPLFGEFVRVYYKYADSRTKSSGAIQNRVLDSDIDTTLDSYVSEFYSTYGKFFPKEIALDKRNFIKILNTIYNAKGTTKALELMFKSVFNESIGISYPGEGTLRASDGVWVRENFITLVNRFGADPVDVVKLQLSNSTGDYSFETTHTDFDGVNLTRCYFQSYSNIVFDDSQLVYQYDALGVLLYVGELVLSPATLRVEIPGQDWQIGQVIIIPGTIRNTIARVTGVSSIGAITSTEIVEAGWQHANGQLVTVSPYPNKPVSSSVEITTVITSVSPLTKTHTISINDFIDGIEENILGISDTVSGDSYFLEDYVEQGYSGQIVIAQTISQTPPSSIADTSGLTIEQWIASRATLSYQFSKVVSARGYYKTDAGQISNQSIKLQDNFFYQAFSYLIETNKDISDYSGILNALHPAGTKRFSNLAKVADIDIDATADRTININ
jgi:hypothetical protein